ncbi:MAG: NAD(+) synthase [Candidatus Obscuribacterales bacterium]|nr:NAD(+) synthase [Candidatus Obscuribacterales bacterium]
MNQQLSSTLEQLRTIRGFDALTCLKAKIALINRHFSLSNLTTAVVGVSGGIDSAVVLGILTRAASQPDSPIQRIVGVLAPYKKIEQGASNQSSATRRGQQVIRHFGAERLQLDLSAPHTLMKSTIETASSIKANAWADGQLVSNLRTPALYHVVTLLTQSGYPAVLFGTTNRDEGAYIGYFGKASDGLCDIQPISDLHKSEVYALGKLLNVPRSILNAVPSGDIWDGSTDLDLIGQPFDAVELYQLLLCLEEDERAAMISSWDKEAQQEFAEIASGIERLHRQNAHKYYGNSPAAHFDVYQRAVPGGWRVESEPARDSSGTFVNAVAFAPSVTEKICGLNRAGNARVEREELPGLGESAFLLHGILSPEECQVLLDEISGHDWLPVGIDGMKRGFNAATDQIGSWRLSHFSNKLAQTLWTRIAPHIPRVRLMSADTPTDIDDHPVWRAVGVAPLMRFIRYKQSGALIPHYDSTHILNGQKRTLMSVVLYVSAPTAGGGGETRFIKDPQAAVPRFQKDYADWTRLAQQNDILLPVKPQTGSALLFDHRLLHDSAPIIGTGEKIIIRTDLEYLRCGLPARVFEARMLGQPQLNSER